MIEYCAGIVKLYNVETPNNKKGSWVNEEDYLRVVEENNKLKENIEKWEEISLKTKQFFTEDVIKLENKIDHYKDYISCLEKEKEKKEKDEEIINMKNNYNILDEEFEKELKEKDEEIERLKKDLKEMTKHKDKTFMKVLELETELFSIKGEETWTLKYIYDVDGVVKEYEQNGMFREDAEELIGMDSDNWNHWSLTKEERPDKDKIIEGLLIRCESNEELIKELESRNENLANELYKLKNDQRLKIKPCDRRA
ncbi:hypothetical protein [Bacillus phage Baseball_field]|uniref:Uncharacterized protein n=1 Tax=Bacillus phage Baseball_field TaxID=2756144 RepID=A0A7L7SKS1_9CAUD|nr:hypothetical protein KNV63_gp06 [Bacillus phage Baseball_field]QOC56866.1 hypothetical protein [Bacillus phage Baseball_field]